MRLFVTLILACLTGGSVVIVKAAYDNAHRPAVVRPQPPKIHLPTVCRDLKGDEWQNCIGVGKK